jgi:hypothetical protein
MTLQETTELYKEWYSLRTNIPSKLRTIVILKSSVKENKYLKKNLIDMPMIFSVPNTICLSATVHELSK